jgi:subtilisin family serine protease
MHRSHYALFVAAGVAAVLLATTPVETQAPPDAPHSTVVDGHEAIAGEALVKFREGSSVDDRLFLEWQVDADESEPVDSRGLRRIHSAWLDTETLVAFLATQPEVEYVEPNYVLRLEATPNDTFLTNLWGLFNNGQTIQGTVGVTGADIGAPSAWNTTTGSRAIVVGVIDSGVDYNHPDLAANMWSAPAPFTVTIGGQNITCPAGTHGFNAINNTCYPMDDNSHGTHVSGTIGATGNNGVGVVGVNWATSIMGLKFLGANGQGATSDALKAVEFAIQAKAAFAGSGNTADVRVLSNSWGGGGFSQAMLDEINKANTNGMLFVAAAGNATWNNDVMPAYPANYAAPNVVSVAATDNRDALASFSDYGVTTVHLGAPGVNTLSTTPNNSYGYKSGTSMATPHVSGAAALLLAACPMSTATLKTTLLNTGDRVASLSNMTITGNRLNVGRAMQACVAGPVSSVTLSANKTAPQPPGTTITWTATPAGGVAPYQYQWLTYDGTTWVFAGNWTTSNTFVWTPTIASNNATVAVWVRSGVNNQNAAEKIKSVKFAIASTGAATGLTIAANRSAPQPAGTTITWTATASGGTAPYQYQWLTFDGTTWAMAGTWSTSNTFAWTPVTASNSAAVGVWVRSAGNSANAAEKVASTTFAITAASATVASATLSANRTAPQPPGTTITWTAVAAGGTAPYQYQWLTYDGTTWAFSGTWTTSNTLAWTPMQASSAAAVAVWVRSAGNTANAAEKVASATFAIGTNGVTGVTLAANRVAPQARNTTITWTATATGGTAPYQYQWLTFDGTTWVFSGTWTTSNTLSWTPTTASNSAAVGVWVRSAGNTANAAEKVTSRTFAIF